MGGVDAMISFLIRKMWKNKWMMLCLFVGNILLVGIVSGTPMYTRATMERILQKNLQQHQISGNVHPAAIELRYIFNNVRRERAVETYHTTRNRYVRDITQSFGVPVLSQIEHTNLRTWTCLPVEQRESRPIERQLDFSGREGYEQNIKLLAGRMPSDRLVDGRILEAVANEATLLRQDLLLDELMVVTNVNLDDEPLYVRVVGQYEAVDDGSLYWTDNPHGFTNVLLISDSLARDFFIENYQGEFRIESNWVIMLDYTYMSAPLVPDYLANIERLDSWYNTPQRIWHFRENLGDTIRDYAQSSEKLTITLWVLQVPIYFLLAFYIYMVSRQILTLEQNDISVLKSRGAGRGQLMTLYTLQGVFVSIVSYTLGMVLGVALCRMLGASSGFLNMVQRTALTVVITDEALLYGGIAIFASLMTMLLPVVKFSRVGIVEYKLGKSGKPKKSLWQRFFLDYLCFGIASYGLYSFNQNREVMAMITTDVQSVDPLLFVSSSLFIIGLGLLCLRFYPYVIQIVYLIGRRFWPPSVYASLLKVIRSVGEEQFIMLFLVLTVAVGIFSAKAARTINLNNDHQIQYLTGADLVFEEAWRNNMPPLHARGLHPGDMPSQIVYFEPDFERFTGFEQVDAITRVTQRPVRVRKPGSTVENVTLMAIETDKFGQTVWFRDDLLATHINHFLNALGQTEEGVLLSENFMTKLDYKLGDFITYRDAADNDARGVVVGFVSHFPSYAPVVQVNRRTGEIVDEDVYLLVTNLGFIQTNWGVLPYQVWMKTNTPGNRFFYDFQQENELRFSLFHDAKAAVTDSKSDPILQGTNGVLTVGFIVTLLVCFTGFLIYWILSIKSRVLQFGIFRAMGMTMRNIVGLLINEQLLITFTAIAIGAGVGEISSRLFVPLIQISFSASQQSIPLLIVTEGRDYINLFITIGTMIVVCLVVLGVYVSRLNIAQALKLGED
jgi:putative ABC transport system permease protein